jgi:hypothetical protein
LLSRRSSVRLNRVRLNNIRHKNTPCVHQRLEVISVTTCVGVCQPNPHFPRPLNVIGRGIFVDTQQEGRMLPSHVGAARHHD